MIENARGRRQTGPAESNVPLSGPVSHNVIIGGTRSGKTYLLAQLLWEREHPKGVVTGEVVTDSGELE